MRLRIGPQLAYHHDAVIGYGHLGVEQRLGFGVNEGFFKDKIESNAVRDKHYRRVETVAVRRPEDLGRVGAPVVGTLERNDGLGGRERTPWLGNLADNGRERLQGPFVLQRRREETGLALEKVAEGMAAPLELDVIVHDDGRLKDLERLRPCHDTEARYEQPQRKYMRE